MTAATTPDIDDDDDDIKPGFYGLRLDAGFSRLDEVRTWARQWAGPKLVEAIDSNIDQLDGLDSGAAFAHVGEGRILVIEKLADGSAACMGTHEDARSDDPGEAFNRAARLGLVRHSSMVIRYCYALPPGVLPDPIPPAMTH